MKIKNELEYSFAVYEDFTEIKPSIPEFESLLSKSKSNNIFLTWDWIYTWYEIFGARYQLHIITGRDKSGKLVLVAPFKIKKKHRLFDRSFNVVEFIGWGELVTPEHLDIIVQAGLENEVLWQFSEFLSRLDYIDEIVLKPFSPKSGNLMLMEAYLKQKNGWTIKSKYSKSPFVKLPDSWEMYISLKSKNFRKKMKEYERICYRDLDFSMRFCQNKSEIDTFFQYLTNLHNHRWKRKSQSFLSRKNREFHLNLMERFIEMDSLRLLIAFDQNKPIAAIYCYKYGKVYYYYQSGRDVGYNKYRLGLVLINNAIRYAIEEGAEEFDFLTGCEAYKFRWAENVHTNYSLTYYKGTLSFIMTRFLSAIRLFGKTLYYLIKKFTTKR